LRKDIGHYTAIYRQKSVRKFYYQLLQQIQRFSDVQKKSYEVNSHILVQKKSYEINSHILVYVQKRN